MAQETTEEFARRLNYAVEGHPLAPPTPHGRQRWLIEKLEKETGVSVSPNTMNKWFRGMSRPREDNVRHLARILRVDEVWLAMGRKPTVEPKARAEEIARASGATLIVAGLLESRGIRISYPGADEEAVSLYANVGGNRFGIIVVTGKETAGKVSYAIPEPVAQNRIVACCVRPDDAGATARVDLLDLTDAPRQSFGGFAVITAERRKDGRVKMEGQRNLLSQISAPEALFA